jgi:ABC-type glycerol-3-phosphate transport system substrate-binding protein
VKIRRTLLGIVALATAATGAFFMAGGTAHAGEDLTTVVFHQSDISLGEVQKAVVRVTKQNSELPDRLAVISGKAVPTVQQAEVLLSGKSVDDITLYKITENPTADATFGDLVEGTPLPALVAYRTRVADGGLHHEVIISCSTTDVCHMYVRDWIIR